MRILIVNTSERTGGAAVAAGRLMEALNKNGIKAKMLVRDKQTDALTVASVGGGWRAQLPFLWERLCIYVRMHFSRKHLFDVDIANAGFDITRLPEFQEADVVHLHWINQGFLSLRSIRKILKSGKTVVWTLHDMWPAMGICHHPRDCRNYVDGCGNCFFLPNGGQKNDLSAAIWEKKQRIWGQGNISFVACSKWLADKVSDSGLLKGSFLTNIPNPIDTRIYCSQSKEKARESLSLPTGKQLLLFASRSIADPRKGIHLFIEAVKLLVERLPEAREHVGIVMLGGHAEDFEGQFPLPMYPLGYVSDERMIVNVYNSVDVFVTPSLDENLPNTIMEAMACGVPCVGFRTGGIPEMIDHRVNGYVADYQSADDLAAGMQWVLSETSREELSQAAVGKVHRCYSQSAVAKRYEDVYRRALSERYK